MAVWSLVSLRGWPVTRRCWGRAWPSSCWMRGGRHFLRRPRRLCGEKGEAMSERPLADKRIAITRAEEQAGDLMARLRGLGAAPLLCPAIAIAPPADFAPLDTAIERLTQYDWLIVTSVNGVRALLGRM